MGLLRTLQLIRCNIDNMHTGHQIFRLLILDNLFHSLSWFFTDIAIGLCFHYDRQDANRIFCAVGADLPIFLVYGGAHTRHER